MTSTNVPANAVLQLAKAASGRRLVREQRSVNVLRRVPAGFPDHHLLSGFVPLQNGSRADAEPSPNFCRNGDLSLSGELGMCQSHR
jgi:hypothetical protein